MKFLVTWQFHEGQLHDTLSFFSQMTAEQDRLLMGEKLKLIGRWHDVVSGRGVAIFESESADALSAYALHWNKYMDLDIAVVLDDEEAKAIGSQLETHAGS
ncbi:DUF3303 domain-containing protein [Photobacterium sagamiensis]|uniref:DUF3303 domain-containing protein n=1 Tax=Photobacterium sagamiensis TaxID=2910241 RepID=UPI003D0EB06E